MKPIPKIIYNTNYTVIKNVQLDQDESEFEYKNETRKVLDIL